jgi:hypothetical protein
MLTTIAVVMPTANWPGGLSIEVTARSAAAPADNPRAKPTMADISSDGTDQRAGVSGVSLIA